MMAGGTLLAAANHLHIITAKERFVNLFLKNFL